MTTWETNESGASGPGYTHNETYPLIAEIIKSINATKQSWAKRSDIREALLRHARGMEIVKAAVTKNKKGWDESRIAGNMIDFWSKDWTTQTNEFHDQFLRQRIDDESAYWSLSFGEPPVIDNEHVIEEEDPYTFHQELELQTFLVRNWSKTELGKKYDIYVDSNGRDGVQYVINGKRIDILAKSKDGTTFLVVELKRDAAGLGVVGQIKNYMGLVDKHLAKPEEKVLGAVISADASRDVLTAFYKDETVSVWRYIVDFRIEEMPK